MGKFIRLVECQTSEEKEQTFLANGNIYIKSEKEFLRIKGNPYAYTATGTLIDILENDKTIGEISKPRQGLASGKNDYFYRFWHEVSYVMIAIGLDSKEAVWENNYRYVPVNKGGGYRKWYGNNYEVIKFDQDNYGKLLASGNHLPSRDLYFKEGITWNKISSGHFSCRYSPVGYIFTDAGMKIIAERNVKAIGALLSSNIVNGILKIFSETLNYETGNISRIPVHFNNEQVQEIEEIFDECVADAKQDWDSFEISWDFTKHPLL